MAKILAVIVLLLCFSKALGRKCNFCISTTSLEDCHKTQKEVPCPSGADYCATLSMKYNLPAPVGETKSFARSCSTKAICDDASSKLQACKSANGTCSFKCCDTDLCNEVPKNNGATEVPTTNDSNAVPMVSSFLILSFIFVTFFHY